MQLSEGSSFRNFFQKTFYRTAKGKFPGSLKNCRRAQICLPYIIPMFYFVTLLDEVEF
jgi:hypothetical protein